MSQHATMTFGIRAQLAEFDRFAGLLEMPCIERLAILNVSEEMYERLQDAGTDDEAPVKPELSRRLSYALPLMRKLAGNTKVVRLPKRTSVRSNAAAFV